MTVHAKPPRRVSTEAPGPEMGAADFNAALDELEQTHNGFAALLRRIGDKRPVVVLLKGLRAMSAGTRQVSGEMQVILHLLRRERAHAARTAALTDWTAAADNGITATLRGVTLTLRPAPRGRWRIAAQVLATGFSPEAPRWRDSLADAKVRAVLAVDEALDQDPGDAPAGKAADWSFPTIAAVERGPA